MQKFLVIFFSCFYLQISAHSNKAISSFEQIYLHLDKQAYVAGETIWFKAYILSDFVPSTNSKNFYINLLDPSGKVIVSKRLPIIWGTSIGSIVLPVTLPQDMYVITACTLSQIKHNEQDYFQIVPVMNPKIMGSIKNKKENSSEKDLEPEEVSIKIKNSSAGKFFTIDKNKDFTSNNLSLCGYMYGEMVFNQSLKNKFPINGVIPVKDLPSGVLQIKLFDDNKNLLAQKLSFINNQEYLLSSNLLIDTINFGSKGENVFTIELPDSIVGSFSVSITDYDKELCYNSENNIISGFLIPSFKKFPVADFLSVDSIKNIDEQILSKEVINDIGTTDSVLADQPYIQIRGKAFVNNKPLKKGEISFLLQTKDSSLTLITAPVEKDGNFVLENLIFEDTATFFYQANNSSINIILDQSNDMPEQTRGYMPKEIVADFNNSIFRDSLTHTIASKVYDIYSNASFKEKTLEQVFVTSKKQSPASMIDKKYTSGLFSGSITAKAIDLINSPPASLSGNVFDYLQGKIAGLRITRKTATRYELVSPRSFSLTGGTIPAKVFLNEMEQEGTDEVATIPLDQIAFIKYFTPGSIGLPGIGISPVLAIYTKKYDDVQPKQQGFQQYFKYPGYSITNDFLATSEYNNNMTNISATLLWKPDITVEENKAFSISFINPHDVKRFHLILEGFTIEGKLVHLEKIISKEDYQPLVNTSAK